MREIATHGCMGHVSSPVSQAQSPIRTTGELSDNLVITDHDQRAVSEGNEESVAGHGLAGSR